MNINLTPQLEELVRSKVAFGLYTSASEVVREALRPLEGRTGLGTQSSRNCVLMLVRD